MAIDKQLMSQKIDDFFEKNDEKLKEEQERKKREEKKRKEEQDKKQQDKQKEKKQIKDSFVYDDPQKENLEVKYNQINYHPPVLQLQRDQLIHSSSVVFNNIVAFISSLFRFIATYWRWIVGVLVLFILVTNLETIVFYGCILLIGGILLYGFLS